MQGWESVCWGPESKSIHFIKGPHSKGVQWGKTGETKLCDLFVICWVIFMEMCLNNRFKSSGELFWSILVKENIDFIMWGNKTFTSMISWFLVILLLDYLAHLWLIYGLFGLFVAYLWIYWLIHGLSMDLSMLFLVDRYYLIYFRLINITFC